MIHITSKLHGVDVAGMRHPAQTVHYTDDQITDEQLAAFAESEYLTVELDGDSADRVIAERLPPVPPEGDPEVNLGAGDDSIGDAEPTSASDAPVKKSSKKKSA